MAVEIDNSCKIDMTPMIDCVFQLIIFLILVIDLQNQDLEPLKLPKARFAVPDEPPPEVVRPIVNILQEGQVVVKRTDIHNPDLEEDPTSVFFKRRKLKDLLDYYANKVMTKKYDEGLKRKLPDDPLLIRADKWTEMHHVAKIMETCGDQNIAIWKVELAVGENLKGLKKETAPAK